jgi:hypothetical protein
MKIANKNITLPVAVATSALIPVEDIAKPEPVGSNVTTAS